MAVVMATVSMGRNRHPFYIGKRLAFDIQKYSFSFGYQKQV
jgi:hypothetical protein